MPKARKTVRERTLQQLEFLTHRDTGSELKVPSFPMGLVMRDGQLVGFVGLKRPNGTLRREDELLILLCKKHKIPCVMWAFGEASPFTDPAWARHEPT